MALEVHGQHYLFEPGRGPPANVVKAMSRRFPLLDGDDEPGEIGLILSVDAPPPGALTTFHYNPLHDLESLWWLTNYFTFDFSSKLLEKSASRNDPKEKAQRTSRRHFPHTLFDDYNSRHNVVTATGYFAQYAYLLPENLRPAGAALEKFRRELVSRYEKTEESLESASDPAFGGLHDSLAESMRIIAGAFEKAQKAQTSRKSRLSQKPLVTQLKKRSRDVERKDPMKGKLDGNKRLRVA